MEQVKAIAACRVSSIKQGLQGDSLDQQLDQINHRVKQLSQILNKNIVIDKVLEYSQSASGEIETQPILQVIEYCKTHSDVRYLFIKSIDRFTRGGSTSYGLLKNQLTVLGVTLIDVFGVVSDSQINTLGHLNVSYKWSNYSPSYITEILESERAKSEVRDILSRLIGASINYVRLGYRVRPAPYGYQNKKVETEHGKRTILEPNGEEASHIVRMFELRAKGTLSDSEIVEIVNSNGYLSRKINRHDKADNNRIIGTVGQKKLKIKQLQRIISNPIYAGINTESWANKPIKERFEGLIPISLWNKANRNKFTIIENHNDVSIIRGELSKWEKSHKKENPDHAYKNVILCPICNGRPYAAKSRSKSGKYFIYFDCRRGHKRWAVRYDDVLITVRSFLKDVEISEALYIKIRDRILHKFQEMRSRLTGESITITKQIEKLQQDKKQIIDKIKVIHSESVLSELEKEVDLLELKIENIKQLGTKKRLEELSVEQVIASVRYYYEHFEELLLEGSDPIKNASMFGLLFEELPTYDELVLRTPKLAPLFKLKDNIKIAKNQSVSRLGLEPRTNSLKGSCSAN